MENYFDIVLKQAYKAFKKKDIPVGAIIVKNDKIIAKSYNTRQKKHDILGHAEINCLKLASKKFSDWRLDGCTMFVSLEPCNMCKLIINESRIDKTYYLLPQKNKKDEIELKNCVFLQTNDCEKYKKKYEELLESFFKNLRN